MLLASHPVTTAVVESCEDGLPQRDFLKRASTSSFHLNPSNHGNLRVSAANLLRQSIHFFPLWVIQLNLNIAKGFQLQSVLYWSKQGKFLFFSQINFKQVIVLTLQQIAMLSDHAMIIQQVTGDMVL